MNRQRDFWKRMAYATPAIAAAGTIFFFSSLEHIDLPLESIAFNDLLLHGAAYFVFGVTLLIAAHPSELLHKNPAMVYGVILAIGMGYGLSDEIHQAFVPNRTASLADFIADTVGVGAALFARHLFWRWKCRRASCVVRDG